MLPLITSYYACWMLSLTNCYSWKSCYSVPHCIITSMFFKFLTFIVTKGAHHNESKFRFFPHLINCNIKRLWPMTSEQPTGDHTECGDPEVRSVSDIVQWLTKVYFFNDLIWHVFYDLSFFPSLWYNLYVCMYFIMLVMKFTKSKPNRNSQVTFPRLARSK